MAESTSLESTPHNSAHEEQNLAATQGYDVEYDLYRNSNFSFVNGENVPSNVPPTSHTYNLSQHINPEKAYSCQEPSWDLLGGFPSDEIHGLPIEESVNNLKNFNDVQSFENEQNPIQTALDLQEISIQNSNWNNDVTLNDSDPECQSLSTTAAGSFFPYFPFESAQNNDLPETWCSSHLNGSPFPNSIPQTEKNTLEFKTQSHMDNFASSSFEFPKIQDPETAFQQIAPYLREVTPHNFSRFLVDVLTDHHRHLPLEAFFHLLYNSKTPYSVEETHTNQLSELEQSTLQFCRLIVNVFQDSRSSRGLYSSLIRNSSIASVNLGEFLRTCLAIKIIFASVTPIESTDFNDSTIPRGSVYKAYHIICQKLAKKYEDAFNISSESLILGQSKLGQLIRLIYPNLLSKRLGRRGESKFHYVGLAWNSTIVDTDMLKLLELEVPELKKHFRDIHSIPDKVLRPKDTHPSMSPKKPYRSPQDHSLIESESFWRKPVHSFVNMSYTYPVSDSSPRDWEATPKQVPQHSKWFQENIERSISVLRAYNIDLKPLIENFNNGSLLDDDHSLSTIVCQTMNILSDASPGKESYMHLYLVVLSLVFPMVISSDEEVPSASKLQLRGSLSTCVSELELEMSNFTDEHSSASFIATLKKMITLSEMSSYKIKSEYAERILKEKVSEFASAEIARADGFSTRSPLEELHIKSIVSSLNSFNFKLMDDSCIEDENGVISSVSKLAKTLVNVLKMTKDKMELLLGQARRHSVHVLQDLPSKVFRIVIQLFHEFTLADPLVKKLPIPVFHFILRNISEEMQSGSVDNFRKRDLDLSKETFKCWWVFFMMLQDYKSIISEIVSLNEVLFDC